MRVHLENAVVLNVALAFRLKYRKLFGNLIGTASNKLCDRPVTIQNRDAFCSYLLHGSVSVEDVTSCG
jgi:hypothetical protein